ncbi:MAG: hypothetical protein GFH27_549283n409 [Chloroflexi bacterium AL-W]|nr:hypothetical protein [Chloroflexi bacterium AL-N1]NOK64470.1 hypothetical protein [Chloroflexi bacterium AL-N10]NOK75712.1 hypothetical protein [Chloroflexi bacterium AL-N5]NOK80530.1 hypothetical protein [Chloroflexi bacterium AL-W]NOK87044.1 hypothetical protein [Chloroflexi bacterium AL-N15]
MPDLRQSLFFIRAVRALEGRYLSGVLGVWESSRPALLASLSGSTWSIQRYTDVMEQAGRAIASRGQQHIPQIVDVVSSYVHHQRETLNYLGLTASQAAIELEPATLHAFAPIYSGLPAWRAGAYGTILTDVQRLQASGQTNATIAATVTAQEITNGRVSAWRRANVALQVAATGAIWNAVNGALHHSYKQLEKIDQRGYQKQAIAAVDGRTTRCCLNVHGQIRELDEMFHLTGTPRYGDYLLQPAFHDQCRTVMALYAPEMEMIGATTEELRRTAKTERDRRK